MLGPREGPGSLHQPLQGRGGTFPFLYWEMGTEPRDLSSQLSWWQKVATSWEGLRHTRACKCMFWGGFSFPQAGFQLETRVCACPRGRQHQQRHPLVPLPASRAWQSIRVTASGDKRETYSPHTDKCSPSLLKSSRQATD